MLSRCVVEPTGAEMLVVCRMAGVEVQASFHERHALEPGQHVRLRPRPELVHLFDTKTSHRLG
ncbi:MAG: TOBE domain-containing protein, partial [Rhodospirillales bacterium]|nr:TOBE domain-containing protein [Rhodospirillales bacterium]